MTNIIKNLARDYFDVIAAIDAQHPRALPICDFAKEHGDDPRAAQSYLNNNSDEPCEIARLSINKTTLGIASYDDDCDISCFALSVYETKSAIYELPDLRPERCVAVLIANDDVLMHLMTALALALMTPKDLVSESEQIALNHARTDLTQQIAKQ